MRDRILLNKELIPYTFQILLADVWYEIQVNYNESFDLFTLSLIKGDEVLTEGEPIVYGVPLFGDIQDYEFPPLIIVPCDEAGNCNLVTFNNLNETVFLSIFDTENDIIKYYGAVESVEITEPIRPGYEFVTAEQKQDMEQTIINKGGIVSSASGIATFEELDEAINSIPSGGGDIVEIATVYPNVFIDNGVFKNAYKFVDNGIIEIVEV